MRLWAGTSINFIEDTVRNQIAEKLRRAESRMEKVIMKNHIVFPLFPISLKLTDNSLFANIEIKEKLIY